MINKKFLAFLLAFLFVLAANAASLELAGKTSATLGDGPVTAKIKLEKNNNRSCPSAASWWWGIEQACPTFRVSALEVKFNGMPVFVPYSAFSDLGNPRTIAVERNKTAGLYVLRIEGGDAADSYKAFLNFKSDLLIEREVHSGEFPDDAWEKTTYKFNY